VPVGPLNLLTDVPGLLVGNAEDLAVRSGVTVVLAEQPCPAAVDVRGGGPGTAETDLLDPAATVERIDAVVLSGGSAFGLEARGGVVQALAEAGRGFAIAGLTVPIVPAAILFDLANGGRKDWGDSPPYHALGAAALRAAGRDFALGNTGAGLGIKAGRLKGGLGSASWRLADGTTVAALVAANPRGSAVMPDGTFWAWAEERDGEFGRPPPPASPAPDPDDEALWAAPVTGANTTLAVVATDAALDKAGCRRLAIMAQTGLARAIRPLHTPLDGDVVFALSTERRPTPDPAGLARLGEAAASCLARAVARALWHADTLGPYPSWRARYRGDGVRN